MTRERRLVAELIFSLTVPVNAVAVHDALVEASPSHRVSCATIHRTLHLLVDSGLIRPN
ncbi:MAG: hypothetical protein HQ518_15855 [Rhodopirellula sp.]|nr:hypothetical protein [Rhodopirellula sp.]